MGRHIGTYELREPISYGATSVVYRGFQASLGRAVAVKELLPEHLRSPEALARFEREARAIAVVSHPNIVQILDYLEVGGARHIVMEYVAGCDLAKAMACRGRLSPDEALAVAVSVADALQFAHARGIIHRDIKPRNILLARSGLVKVADFGIARIMGPEDGNTGTGFVGTPAYTAPEQMLGKRVDGRADIFSLGVVMYEMLTGVKPFRNDPDSNVVSKILEEEPVSPRTLNRRVSRTLQRIILRCLQKDPERRYADMYDLGADLHAARSAAERDAPRALTRLTLSIFGPDNEETQSTGEPLPVALPRVGGSFLRWARRGGAARLRHLAVFGTVGVLGLFGALLLMMGGSGASADEGLTTGPDGFFKVVAYPWAEVYVDGELVETTPTSRSLRLPPGEHELRLRHPDLPEYETTLQVEAGSFQRLRVDLTGNGRFAAVERP